MFGFVELLLAFFATLGILALLWLLFGRMLFPLATSLPLCAVIPVVDDATCLEFTLHQLLWLKNGRLVEVQVVLLDQGLSATGLTRVSRLLAENPSLRFTTPDKLPELMEKDG